ncbi:MAG: hypothetical protein KA258_06840 [Deltaproteobacteria bacterium]|jgi:hypothetical protein|nr:hypothetical protein [Deltaproteobacteria bacterium]
MAQLEQCVVVSARVLGLSRLLRRSPEAQAPRAMALIREIFAGLQGVDVSLQVDSRLLLWSKLIENGRPQAVAVGIAWLLGQLAVRQMMLAKQGFFLSGAVGLGKVLWDVERGHRDLTGTGLRRVRQLARRNLDPCLLIAPEIVELGGPLGQVAKARAPSPYVLWRHIQPDGWGRWFWDYLGCSSHRGEPDRPSSYPAVLESHRMYLGEQLERHAESKRLPTWLVWLCHYHNRSVRWQAKQFAVSELAGTIRQLLIPLPRALQRLELPSDLRLIDD